MKIGYRRAAGKLPLTDNETGARGTWLEKRLALLRELRQRNHEILYWNNLTDPSKEAGLRTDAYQPVDLLIIEFAGGNLSFYRDDYNLTNAIIKEHAGPILYLCDDPDLPYPWHTLPNEDWSRWTIGINAINLNAARKALKIPTPARVIDLPFASLLPQHPYQTPDALAAIYYGRPNGRTNLIKRYLGPKLLIAGKPKEWAELGIPPLTPPEQHQRAYWYSRFAICLALYDNKHAQLGFRTGRAYHALNAGTPVTAPIGNPGLAWTAPAKNHTDLAALINTDLAELHKKQLRNAHPAFPWQELNL